MNQYRYCFSAQEETDDGKTSTSGYLTCTVKSQGFSLALQYCEKETNSACMVTFKFDRESNPNLISFENENIRNAINKQEIKAQKERESLLKRVADYCRKLGVKPGSRNYTICIERETIRNSEPKEVQPLNNNKLAMIDVMQACNEHHNFTYFFELSQCLKNSYSKHGTTPNASDVKNFYALIDVIDEDFDRNKISMIRAKAEVIKAWQSTIDASNKGNAGNSFRADPAEAYHRHIRYQDCLAGLPRGGVARVCLP